MRPAARWLALGGLCLGFFMLLLDSTIVSIALPDIVRDLGTDDATAVWINSAYLFAYAVPLLVAGRLGDRYGHRRLYLVGLAVFTIASIGCALAPGLVALVAGRALQGVGAALLTPQCLSIIRSRFAPPQLAIALAVWSAGGGAATVAGPLIGGVLVEAWGWPSIFLINVPIAILTAVVVLRFVPVSTRVSIALPITAVAGVSAGVLGVVLGVQGTSDGLLAEPIPRLLSGLAGIALVITVLTVQRSAGDGALVPLDLFRDRAYVTASLGAAAAAFCVSSAAVPLMLDLQRERGLTPGAAALVLVPMGIACVAPVPFVGRLTNASGARTTALVGAVTLAVSVTAAALLIGGDAPLWAVAAAFAGFGIANAFVWSPFSLTAMLGSRPATVGAASSVFNTLKQLGAVFGSAATALALAQSSEAEALGMLAVAALVAVAAAALLPGATDPVVVLEGAVVHGAGVGHELGFPTANLLVAGGRPVPTDGVYLGTLSAAGWPAARDALVSIGSNSTFSDRPRTVEVHVLDFDGDLYGLDVELTVGRRLRRQRTYAGPDALIAAMRDDERRARSLLART